LNEEWDTNDDESIGKILQNYMISYPYWANHNYHQDEYIDITFTDKFSIKLVMYKENRLPEHDYRLHDIVTSKFLGLLKL
jgi:argonaute-like protein implicated in RNA metabolism and viral defense